MERKCKRLVRNLAKELKLDSAAATLDGGESAIASSSVTKSKAQNGDEGEEDDDDFGYDPERYVTFDEKSEFADSIKRITKEGLTQMVNYLKEKQPDALEDIGGDRLQIRIDLIEREAFTQCRELLHLNIKEAVPNKRQKVAAAPVFGASATGNNNNK